MRREKQLQRLLSLQALSYVQAEGFCLEMGTEGHLLSSAVYSCERPDSADGGRDIKRSLF